MKSNSSKDEAMTLHELADLDAESLEKLSSEELYKICEPMFNVTRPEQARSIRSVASSPAISFADQQKLKLLEANGVDISFMAKGLKKKAR